MKNKSEKDYRQLERLGQKLGIPIPMMYLEMEVKMPDGSIVHHHKQRSHTWVRNAYNHLFSQLAGRSAVDSTFGAGLLSIKDTGGTVRYSDLSGIAFSNQTINSTQVRWELPTATYNYGYMSPATSDDYGIVVGSGTTAYDFEQYKLTTLIVNGTGAGQLSYAESEANTDSYDVPSKTFTVTLVRYMNNNSGGNVDVNEVGLYARGTALYGVYNDWCQSRDLLASTITIPTTGQLKTQYTIALVFPS
jgi:hypothetical protein